MSLQPQPPSYDEATRRESDPPTRKKHWWSLSRFGLCCGANRQPFAHNIISVQMRTLLEETENINAFSTEICDFYNKFVKEVCFKNPTGFGGAQPLDVVNTYNNNLNKMLDVLAGMLKKYKAGLIAVDDENKSNLNGFNDSNRLEVLLYESCESNTLDALRANVNQILLVKFEEQLRKFASGLS